MFQSSPNSLNFGLRDFEAIVGNPGANRLDRFTIHRSGDYRPPSPESVATIA